MNITFETTTNVATLSGPNTIKAGSQIPVQLSFTTNGQPSALASTPTIQIGITAQTSSPTTLAFLNSFTELTPNTFTGILNANDTRLVAAMASTTTATMNLECAVTISSLEYIAPNVSINVQQQQISGPASSEGGPTYVTSAVMAAALAALAGCSTAVALPQGGLVSIAPAQAFLSYQAPLALGAGSGAYTQNVVLSDANAVAGSVMYLPMDFAASANGTLEVFDGSTGGTLLEGPLTNYDPANAHSFLLICRFDGTNWHKMDGHWIP
jgi:hypothetical protein